MRALISVSDKTGIVELSQQLHELQFEIISTGGTAKALKQAQVPVLEVSEMTGFPEILEGRVKTLHPKIFGGILYDRESPKHKGDIEKYDIPEIDWVIVNLYPFEKIYLENRLSKFEMIEFMDIGGVSLLRAGAKNFKSVVVLTDQSDYQKALDELKDKKTVSLETKRRLAAKAFAHTAHYDSTIARFFREFSVSGHEIAPPLLSSTEETFPTEWTLGLRKLTDLRYGENPQQKAALYKESGMRDWGVVSAEKIQGKELSFNNYLDLDNAWQIVNSFNLSQTGVCCSILKHTNPCGVAIGKNTAEAFRLAFNADSLSAFGGIIGFSSAVDRETAEQIAQSFFECIIAPDFAPEALEIFKKKPNLRLLRQTTQLSLPYEFDLKKISGGVLIQERDLFPGDIGASGKIVTRCAPTPEELFALDFSWKICKLVKSNAIVLARGTVTQGIGAGQMSRIDALKAAIQKMRETQRDAQEKNKLLSNASELPLVLASDAFFPFRDCVDEAAKAGVAAIIQPGGSIRDQESVDAANEHNMAMIFTGIRHFRH